MRISERLRRNATSGPVSKCQASTSASNRFQRLRGSTRVPTRARASIMPLAASVLSASRSTVRDTEKRCSNSVSEGKISPSR
jgi:hypothetical protein